MENRKSLEDELKALENRNRESLENRNRGSLGLRESKPALDEQLKTLLKNFTDDELDNLEANGKLIGQGAYGKVFLINVNGKELVLKKLANPEEAKLEEQINNAIVEQINKEEDQKSRKGYHKKIAAFYSIKNRLISTYAGYKSLDAFLLGLHRAVDIENEIQSFIISEFKKNPVAFLNLIAITMRNRIKDLHKLNIIHNDIAARNFLIDIFDYFKFGTKNLPIRIADFGQAITISHPLAIVDEDPTKQMAFRWCSNQRLYDNKVSVMSEMFSFKATLITILSFFLRLNQQGGEADYLYLETIGETNRDFASIRRTLSDEATLKKFLYNVEELAKLQAQSFDKGRREMAMAVCQFINCYRDYLTYGPDLHHIDEETLQKYIQQDDELSLQSSQKVEQLTNPISLSTVTRTELFNEKGEAYYKDSPTIHRRNARKNRSNAVFIDPSVASELTSSLSKLPNSKLKYSKSMKDIHKKMPSNNNNNNNSYSLGSTPDDTYTMSDSAAKTAQEANMTSVYVGQQTAFDDNETNDSVNIESPSIQHNEWDESPVNIESPSIQHNELTVGANSADLGFPNPEGNYLSKSAYDDFEFQHSSDDSHTSQATISTNLSSSLFSSNGRNEKNENDDKNEKDDNDKDNSPSPGPGKEY